MHKALDYSQHFLREVICLDKGRLTDISGREAGKGEFATKPKSLLLIVWA
jgi:hypothetical protein